MSQPQAQRSARAQVHAPSRSDPSSIRPDRRLFFVRDALILRGRAYGFTALYTHRTIVCYIHVVTFTVRNFDCGPCSQRMHVRDVSLVGIWEATVRCGAYAPGSGPLCL